MSLSDLFPTRWGFFVFFLFAGILWILGLEYAYWQLPNWTAAVGDTELKILDFTASGNLAGWFSTILWFYAATICFLLFQLDRKAFRSSIATDYRLSDIWLWAVFGCLLLSVDATCQIREFLRIVLIKVSGTKLYGNGDVWWIAIYLVIFGMIGSRLLVEMRHHLLSCNTFFLSALAYLLACCLALNLLELPSKEERIPMMLRTGMEMGSALFAVFSFSLFARRMVLQIETGIKSPVKKKTRAKNKDTQIKKDKKNNVSELTASTGTVSQTEERKLKTGTMRTCPIIFPTQGGEKIVKIEEIEPIEIETLEKRKKVRPQRHPKPPEPEPVLIVTPEPEPEPFSEDVETGLEDDEDVEYDDDVSDYEDADEEYEYEYEDEEK